MKMITLLFSCLFFIPVSNANFGNDIAKMVFQKKVDQLYEQAIKCDPLKRDQKSKMDVRDWIKIQPPLPAWQMFASIEETAEDARNYARSIGGRDKQMHCLAGCFIAKKLDYTSAVLVGWLKELSDASDCSNKTSFEKRDYELTEIGAMAGSNNQECEFFCKKKKLK